VNIIKITTKAVIENDPLENVLSEVRGNFTTRLDNINNIQTVKNRKKRFSIILMDCIESFRILNKQIDPKVFSFSGFFVFILIDGKITEIEEIFSTLWQRNIFNVDVIFQDGGSIDVMTFMPFSESKCDDTTPRLVNRFANGSFEKNIKETIFPEKFENLNKCEIKIVTFEDNILVIRSKSSNGIEKLSGYDMDILDELSKSMNFEKKIKFIEGPLP
jgi:hypothetical protein